MFNNVRNNVARLFNNNAGAANVPQADNVIPPHMQDQVRALNNALRYNNPVDHARHFVKIGNAFKPGDPEIVVDGMALDKKKCYSEAIKHDPAYSNAYLNLGFALDANETIELTLGGQGQIFNQRDCFLKVQALGYAGLSANEREFIEWHLVVLNAEHERANAQTKYLPRETTPKPLDRSSSHNTNITRQKSTSTLQTLSLPGISPASLDIDFAQFSTSRHVEEHNGTDTPSPVDSIAHDEALQTQVTLNEAVNNTQEAIAPADDLVQDAPTQDALHRNLSRSTNNSVPNDATLRMDAITRRATPNIMEDDELIQQLMANRELLGLFQQSTNIDLPFLLQQLASSGNANMLSAEERAAVTAAANILQSLKPVELERLKEITTAFSDIQIEEAKHRTLREKEMGQVQQRLKAKDEATGYTHDIVNQGKMLYDGLYQMWIDLPSIMTKSRLGMTQIDLSRRGKQANLLANGLFAIPLVGGLITTITKVVINEVDKKTMATHVHKNLLYIATPSANEDATRTRMHAIAHALALRMTLHFSNKQFDGEKDGKLASAKQNLGDNVTGTRAAQNLSSYFERILHVLNNKDLPKEFTLHSLESTIDSLVAAALTQTNTLGNRTVSTVAGLIHKQEGDTRAKRLVPNPRTPKMAQEEALKLKKRHKNITEDFEEELHTKVSDAVQPSNDNDVMVIPVPAHLVPANVNYSTPTMAMVGTLLAAQRAASEENFNALQRQYEQQGEELRSQKRTNEDMMKMLIDLQNNLVPQFKNLQVQFEQQQERINQQQERIDELTDENVTLQNSLDEMRTQLKVKANQEDLAKKADQVVVEAQQKDIHKLHHIAKVLSPAPDTIDVINAGSGQALAQALRPEQYQQEMQEQQIFLAEVITELQERVDDHAHTINTHGDALIKQGILPRPPTPLDESEEEKLDTQQVKAKINEQTEQIKARNLKNQKSREQLFGGINR